MVKHTQTICRLLRTNCLNVFDHFVDLALKGLRLTNLCSADIPDNALFVIVQTFLLFKSRQT